MLFILNNRHINLTVRDSKRTDIVSTKCAENLTLFKVNIITLKEGNYTMKDDHELIISAFLKDNMEQLMNSCFAGYVSDEYIKGCLRYIPSQNLLPLLSRTTQDLINSGYSITPEQVITLSHKFTIWTEYLFLLEISIQQLLSSTINTTNLTYHDGKISCILKRRKIKLKNELNKQLSCFSLGCDDINFLVNKFNEEIKDPTSELKKDLLDLEKALLEHFINFDSNEEETRKKYKEICGHNSNSFKPLSVHYS